MKKTAVIMAVFLTASSISACSQAELKAMNYAEPTTITSTATPSEAEKSRINTEISASETTETENAEKSPVSAFQEPTGVSPTTAEKAGVGQTSGKQSGVSQSGNSSPNNGENGTTVGGSSDRSSPGQDNSSAHRNEPDHDEKPQSNPTPKPTEATKTQPKPTEAPKPKPTEPPAEKKEIDFGQVVCNLIAYGQQLGMVYNGSLGTGNAGWFPPTDVSGYSDTNSATSACYGDVEYVIYYYSGLGAEPSDIMFNVIASGGQIYVVYA